MEQLDFSIPDEHSKAYFISPIRTMLITNNELRKTGTLIATHPSTLQPKHNAPTEAHKEKGIKLKVSATLSNRVETSIEQYKFTISDEILSQLTMIKKITPQIRETISRLKAANPLQKEKRKIIVLDLDETLCLTVPLTLKDANTASLIPLSGELTGIGVIKRPYLNIFLSMLKKHYTLMVSG